MIRNRNALWVIMAVISLFSCRSSDSLRSLQVISVLNASGSCEFQVGNDPLSLGFYDPAVPDTSHYTTALLVQNNLGQTQDLVTTWSTSVAAETHPVQLQTIEACWYLAASGDAPHVAATTSGIAVDCSTLPVTQTASYPTGILIPAGITANQGAVMVPILTMSQLKAVFGDSFSPTDIPSVGTTVAPNPALNNNVANVTQTTADILSYDFGPVVPGPPGSGRAAAWGEKYPETAEALVVYQFRAVGRTAGGGILHSNWYSFPITICPKCAVAQCGPLVQANCAQGPCSDGTPCLNGTCANTSLTCSATTLFSGTVPTFSGGICLPAQALPGITPPTCTEVGCPPTE